MGMVVGDPRGGGVANPSQHATLPQTPHILSSFRPIVYGENRGTCCTQKSSSNQASTHHSSTHAQTQHTQTTTMAKPRAVLRYRSICAAIAGSSTRLSTRTALARQQLFLLFKS